MLGNTINGLKTVTGWGTSGQLLTSTGAGTAPTWQSASFDTTQNYLFSGNNNFTGNIFLKNPIASSTIKINNGGAGVTYVFPTALGASSTVLSTDASGNLTWEVASTTTYKATNTAAIPTATNNTQSVTATCNAGDSVIAGGFSGLPSSAPGNGTGQMQVYQNYPDTASSWTLAVLCAQGTCTSGTMSVYAICLKP